MIAEIVVDIKSSNVNKIFDYLVPSCFETTIKVGQRVIVPFGYKKLLGYVVDLKENSEYENLKSIIELKDLIPCINEEQIYLAKHMYKYYFCLYVSCLEIMIPSSLKAKYTKVFITKDSNILPIELRSIFDNGIYEYKNNDKKLLPLLQTYVDKNLITVENRISDKGKAKTICYVRKIKDDLLSLTGKQKEVLSFIANQSIKKAELVHTYSAYTINKLIKEGFLLEEYKEQLRLYDSCLANVEKQVTLNDEQQNAFNIISSSLNKNKTFLLDGVTGSGKTEVYIKLIEKVIANNKNAIMLVPEISLTPQIVARFKGHFGQNVAVLHSGLSTGEKYDEWRRIIRKEVNIVIGARSAIFAPLLNIGIIIIDEEHEKSYKQDNSPRYDARLIARIRAKRHQCPCVLGSATPSIVSYYMASIGKYELVKINKRANGKNTPMVKIVDMSLELKNGNFSVLSKELQTQIALRLKQKEQVILLINRRGFANFVMCRECGSVIKCPHCDISLTYHKVDNLLKCHYCGYEEPNVKSCPKCGSSKIRFVGSGTQKVYEEIGNLFKEARVLRMDRDNTQNKGATAKIINDFANYKADILVGTQMVAKGLDFPKCSLVGILNGDLALKYPSYDSAEEAYDLLVQVSGRAGRHDTQGLVVLQSYDINHYAIRNACGGTYDSFYKEELMYRKIGSYPPFTKMIDITVYSSNYEKSFREAEKICSRIGIIKDVTVLGPAEDFIVKKEDNYYFKVNIKYCGISIEKQIENELSDLYYFYVNNTDVKIIIDRL